MANLISKTKKEQVEKNIYKRGESSFQVKMMVHGHKISETFDDLISASEFCNRKRLESATDPHLKETYQTRITKSEARSFSVDAALERYLAEVTPLKKGCRPEQMRIGKLRRCKIAQKSFYHVNAQDIKDMMTEVAASGSTSGNAQRKYGLILSHMYNVARKEWGMKVQNPVSDVKLPGNGKSRERRYEAGEEKRVLRECRRSGNPWVIKSAELAVATASRQGELFKLQWAQINISKKVALLIDTKNGDNREIPLSPSAIAILKDLAKMGASGSVIGQNKRRAAAIAESLGMSQKDCEKLNWVNIDIQRFSPAEQDTLYELAIKSASGLIFKTTQSAVAQAFKKSVIRARTRYEAACARAGVQPEPKFLTDLRMHDLRHEATSRFFEMGIFGDREVMKITGHKTASMLGKYTHLRASDLADKMTAYDKKKNEH